MPTRLRTTLLTVAVGAALLAGCGDGSTATDATGATPVDLPTGDWRPGQGGNEALISGTLALDEDGCVVLAGGEAGARYVVWPADWSAELDADGLRLLDADGEEVAREGDEVRAGGGYGQVEEAHPCLPRGQEVATVQSEVEVTGPSR